MAERGRADVRRRRAWTGALAAAAVGYAPVSPLAPWLLRRNDTPAPADMLVVLGGDARDRMPLAEALFRRGWAPRVLLSGRGDYVWSRAGLIARGVPPERILVEDRSASTRENALFSAPILRDQGVRRAILVTSWQHSARALRTFRHLIPGVAFRVTSTAPGSGWLAVRSRREAVQVYLEFAKTAVYCVAYGICPGGDG